ncbi:hypothetical protein QYE76_022838 [Lolium multiflorum]|uniref:Reverse transcriptase domain-containing protein n=1 Tax=Lolium multiflorum TaxID=4521 RepID=A0AAD8RB11_LOLMU|nr:hypothetical protein QYE76_022838 [Lolium multiflorum]
MAEEQITYKDLPAEHKKKYDELKAICEAELIGSFETTRSHSIKLKGDTRLSHGVNTIDLSHSIREPGFSFSVNVARLVNCHSADKAESSHSRGKDKEEAVPRDRPQDDDRRYLIEEKVRSTRYQRPLSARLLNECEQQYDRRQRYDEDDERYRRSDAGASTTDEGRSLGRSQEGDQEDVGRRFIRPCRYAEWISNVVPVEKKDGRWRVAIDFRNLNSATPKDEYPMPVAETLINAAAGHKILSFMDGNAGYNQIFMAPEDIHKTAFRVPGSVGLFEYVVMTFGLKNAGATYQRAMNYIFHDLIGKLVEIYIDDVVVKSVATDGHLEDLRRVLDRTRKFGLRMNPKKCAFGVTAGQFLGFLVHERGIEIGLKSQEAVRTMKPPTIKKELQCLIGKINFVRRFISNLSGRIEPFMGLVKIKPDEEFRWGAEQQQAFDDIKEYLTKPPVLVPPRQTGRSIFTCQ